MRRLRLQVLSPTAVLRPPLEGVILASLALQALAIVLGLVGVLALPLTWFRDLTGIEVGTSGMTRAGSAMLHGEIAASLALNPFLLPLLAALAVVAWRCATALRRGTTARLDHPGVAILAILAAATVYRNALAA